MSSFKFKLSAVILVLGILSLTTGISYSIFSTKETSEKTEVIRAGAVTLKLEENNTFSLEDMYQMNYEQGLSQSTYYDFNITNTGDADSKVTLYLIDDTNKLENYDGIVLSKEYIRTGLEINGIEQGGRNTVYKDGSFGEDQIKIGETKNYKLRIWLDFTGLSNEKILSLEKSSLFLKVKVIAEQDINSTE